MDDLVQRLSEGNHPEMGLPKTKKSDDSDLMKETHLLA
jgi:hypothetical protein